MSEPSNDVAIRDGLPGDTNLVYSSWINSYQFRVKMPRHPLPKCTTCGRQQRPPITGGEANSGVHDYGNMQHARITRLLADGRAGIVVVHPVDSPLVVYAWACLDRRDPRVAHYVYTWGPKRQNGYARILMRGRTVVTHMTDSRRPDSFKWWAERGGVLYQPHLLDVLG